jgi:hypothetical protein
VLVLVQFAHHALPEALGQAALGTRIPIEVPSAQ